METSIWFTEVRALLVKARPDLAHLLSQAETEREIGFIVDTAALVKSTQSSHSLTFTGHTTGRVVDQARTIPKDERFDVILSGVVPNRHIHAIKAVRNITGMGLRDAKDFCDRVRDIRPELLVSFQSAEQVSKIKAELAESGATVKVHCAL